MVGGLHVWHNYTPRLFPAGLLILAASYTIFVFVSADPGQIAFLSEYESWSNHAQHYFDAKLLMFLLYTVPLLCIGFFVCLSSDLRAVFWGTHAGVLFVACVAAIRLLASSEPLLHYDYAAVREFFFMQRGFSVVSYGMLFTIGAASALVFRRTWPLAALFLFLAFWMSRRTETVIIVAIVLTHYGILAWKDGSRPGTFLRPILIIGLSALVAVPLHNEANLRTWKVLDASANERRVLLEGAITGQADHAAAREIRRTDPEALNSEDRHQYSGSIWFGSGLGSFTLLNLSNSYPHNLLLESYHESGLAAAIPLLTLLGAAFGSCTWRIVRTGKIDRYWLGTASIAFALFLIAMKSGDATNAGRLLFLCILVAHSGKMRASSPPPSRPH